MSTPKDADCGRISSDFSSGAWRKAFPAPDFEPASERHVRNAHIGSAEEVVLKRTMSVSFIAGLPSDERAALERDIRALIDRTPVLRDKRVSFPACLPIARRKVA
ncbi:hypothetical protein [Sphingomonas sp. ABOLE]|uniref:hypothetical protein n=1 Tax=Sphingomonas sp. ABOLE TaxID=1985878 RepID=UPI000F7E58E5|nr:hypothetical protein [Sphingomonas sp. ABOLE]